MKKDELLSALNKVNTDQLTKKESEKNIEDEARSKRNASQFNNQTKFGAFFVDWLIVIIKVVSLLFGILVTYYLFTIMSDQNKLEDFLATAYSEIKLFLEKYQAVIAAVAAFIFGGTLKNKKK